MTKDGLFNLLKPAPFKSVKNGDPETLLQDFEEYVEVMGKFRPHLLQEIILSTTRHVGRARRRRP